MTPESPKPLSGNAGAMQPPPPFRLDRSDEEDIIDLARYGRAFLRRWKLAVVGALLGGALAFWLASLRPLRYEAVTTLLVVPPSRASDAQISGQINPATFRAIVENATLVSQVIQELKLQDGLTPQVFLERALRVEEVRGTNIVKLRVTLPDPATAAKASRMLAMKAIVLTQQVNQQGGDSIQEQLKKHVNDALERLQNAERELLSYKQRAQVELIRGDADAELRERGGLLGLVINIEAERARLASAEQEIKRQQPLLSVARVPGAEDALRRTQSASKGEVDAQHLDLTNPFVNPVYQTLDFQISTTRTRIAALEKQRDEVMNVKKLGGKELDQLSELYRRQIEQARLQANSDLAMRVYSDLALRYEQSRTQPLGNTAQLLVVDDALPPDRPVARRRLQYAAIGAVAGMVGTVLMALLWENRGRRRQQRPV